MEEFAMILGPEPKWVTCECGAQTQRVPCWDCQRADEVRREMEHQERRAGIPSRFAWARLSAPELAGRCRPVGNVGEPVQANVVAAMVIQHPGPAVVFYGQAGSGKTSLAVACLREVPGGMMVHAGALGRARIEHQAGQGEAPLIRRAMQARVLLIDDLGQDKSTQVSAVEDVINVRHDAELATWVTTGLTSRQVEERYGAGVRRRLTERGTALVVRFGDVQQPTNRRAGLE